MEDEVFYVRGIMGKPDARFSFRLSGKRIDMILPGNEINVRQDDPPAHIRVDEFDNNGGKLK
jgi:hypothetical protein